MGRQYKKGDILIYVGNEDILKGKRIQLDTKEGDWWDTVSNNDGVYNEDYLDDNYTFIKNVLETDTLQVNMENEELTNTARYSTNSGKQLFDVLADDLLTDDLLTDDQYEGFLIGNIYKYIKRHKEKGGITDLEKVRVYLDTLIKFEEER